MIDKEFLRRNWLVITAVVMILIAIISVFRHPHPTLTEPHMKPGEPPFKKSIAGIGVIEPKSENIEIGTPISGIVTRVYVIPGQKIKANSPLFTIDDRDARARLAAAQAKLNFDLASLNEAKHQLSLYEKVDDRRAISKDEMIRRQDSVKINEARVEETKANVNVIATELDRLTVKSPIDATILKVTVDPGEFAVAGDTEDPLIILGNIDILHVRVEIDETDAMLVSPQSKAIGFLRGYSDRYVELKFVSEEPLLTAKKSLSNKAVERVDTKVKEFIYTFDNSKLKAHAGQRMDVYIEFTH